MQISKLVRFSFLLLVWGCLSCQSLTENEDKVISAEDELIDTRIALANTQLDNSQPELALDTLQILVKTHPDDVRVLTLYGLTHLALANSEKARQILEKAYKQDPSGKTALNYSSVLIFQQSYKEAIAILEKGLEDSEYSYKERLYHNLGVCWEKSRNNVQAKKYFAKALFEQPTYYQSLLQLGLIYKKEGNYPTALLNLEKAASYCKVCLEPIQELMEIYKLQNKNRLSIKLLNEFIKNKDVSKKELQTAKKLLHAERMQKN